MSVAKKPRQPSQPKAKSAKPQGTDPNAAQARATKAAAKAKVAELKKAKADADKAAKAKVAEEKKAKAAAEREAKARAAELKKKAAAERAARPKPPRNKKPTDASPEPLTLDSIEKQIREAYLRETRGAVKERVLLKDLRPKVGIQSDDFDQALLAMQQQGKVVLMGLDNPMERTPEVEAAAVHIAGLPRYLVYFQG
ncbi:MAG: hypothetical protein ABW061_19115 [Polyangiaceae bacterium]